MSAQEAEKHGLVSKVVPVADLIDEAVKVGEKISGMSKIAVSMAKQAVNAANNLSLDEGKVDQIFYYHYDIFTTFQTHTKLKEKSPKSAYFS